MSRDPHREIEDAVLDYIQHGHGAFETLAIRVFEYQCSHNPLYGAFCVQLRKTPDRIGHWRDIPAAPTAAFKEVALWCRPPEQIFLSSGTTRGPEHRSRHGFPRLEVYHASLLTNFASHLLPDGARPRILALTPSPDLAPASSLIHMIQTVIKTYGKAGSTFFIGSDGLQVDRLLTALIQAAHAAEPIMLLGLTQAVVQLLDALQQRGLTIQLPPGSRLMDTGGMKGSASELDRAHYYADLEEHLGIPEVWCVNEYGMTELGSQFYDPVLSNHVRGRQDLHEASREANRIKVVPPWVRTVVVDPETLEEVPTGTTGLLRHWDLANCGSVLAVQTEDLGYRSGEGVVLIGRARGAEPRGCAMLLEEFHHPR